MTPLCSFSTDAVDASSPPDAATRSSPTPHALSQVASSERSISWERSVRRTTSFPPCGRPLLRGLMWGVISQPAIPLALHVCLQPRAKLLVPVQLIQLFALPENVLSGALRHARAVGHAMFCPSDAGRVWTTSNGENIGTGILIALILINAQRWSDECELRRKTSGCHRIGHQRSVCGLAAQQVREVEQASRSVLILSSSSAQGAALA